jgi:hypothetical protein
MIFAHTIDNVLNGTKTQTSRIWKDNYVLDTYEGHTIGIRSQRGRLLYYIGQELSVQSARGTKGIARIRIQELHKCDVRDFDADDFKREGFEWLHEFIEVWIQMHDKGYWQWSLKFPELGFMGYLSRRPKNHYTALVFIFELVTEAVAA